MELSSGDAEENNVKCEWVWYLDLGGPFSFYINQYPQTEERLKPQRLLSNLKHLRCRHSDYIVTCQLVPMR